jgi:hypothetical protein
MKKEAIDTAKIGVEQCLCHKKVGKRRKRALPKRQKTLK